MLGGLVGHRVRRCATPGTAALGLCLLAACNGGAAPAPAAPESRPLANVVSAEVEESVRGIVLAVGVSSPDQGCHQYADWWEVLDENGELVQRRVLAHSHIAEQPFVRRGGPVDLDEDTVVWVRAHMHPTGYGGAAFHGSIARGFAPAELDASFAADLEEVPPQPPECRN